MSLLSRFRKAPPHSAAARAPQSAPASPPQAITPPATESAAHDEERLQAAIAVRDMDALAKIVIDGSSTKVRQSAAEAIEDLEQIRVLLRTARNDKNVHRILGRKRDALLDVE